MTPATTFVAGFVGLSNQVPAVLTDGMVTVHGETLPLLGDSQPDGPVLAYIRPEDIEFASSGIPAIVVSSSFLGSLRRTRLRLADDSLISVQHEVRAQTRVGESVHLRFTGRPVSARQRP